MPVLQQGRKGVFGRSGLVKGPGRVQVEVVRSTELQTREFKTPTQGLISNISPTDNIQGSALVMQNFWPRASGVEPRGGYRKLFELDDPVRYIVEYEGPTDYPFLAATDNGIYQFDEDAESVADVQDGLVTAVTSGDFSSTEMRNDAGNFLVMVNGQDDMIQFNGSGWSVLNNTSDPAVTGVDPTRLIYTWTYGNRLFFIEENSMKAWYGAPNAISGELTKLPLGGVFNRSATLLFGATWSSDSGSGLDDRCVFVTAEGEVAVFTGQDPSQATSWTLDGVYDMGRPLNKHLHVQIAGDLVIGTEEGLIPMSAVVQRDPTALKANAFTRPIGDLWELEMSRAKITDRLEWRVCKWPVRNMLLISMEDNQFRPDACFAANLENNAWTQFTGWSLKGAAPMGDGLYLITKDGAVAEAWNVGRDDGEPYNCRFALPFDDMGAPGLQKKLSTLRFMWQLAPGYPLRHTHSVNYRLHWPPLPLTEDPIQCRITDGATWDESAWDVTSWTDEDSVTPPFITETHKITSSGYAISLQVELRSDCDYRIKGRFLAMHLGYHLRGQMTAGISR